MSDLPYLIVGFDYTPGPEVRVYDSGCCVCGRRFEVFLDPGDTTDPRALRCPACLERAGQLRMEMEVRE